MPTRPAGFALTADGQQVYEQTLQLLASVDAFRSSIEDLHHRLGGQLEVAVFDKTASNPQATSATPSPTSVRERPRCV